MVQKGTYLRDWVLGNTFSIQRGSSKIIVWKKLKKEQIVFEKETLLKGCLKHELKQRFWMEWSIRIAWAI